MKIFWTNSIAGVIISVGVAMGLMGSYHKEADGKPAQWALKEDNAPSKAVFEKDISQFGLNGRSSVKVQVR